MNEKFRATLTLLESADDRNFSEVIKLNEGFKVAGSADLGNLVAGQFDTFSLQHDTVCVGAQSSHV